MMNRTSSGLLLASAVLALSFSACFDFDKAYDDCYALGNCHDQEAPKVVSTDPPNRATDVSPDTFIAIEFDKPMNPDSVEASLEPGVALVAANWNDTVTRATFTPSKRLDYGTQYTIRAGGSAREGGVLNPANVGTFTVMAEPQGPKLVSSVPVSGSNVVAIHAGLTLTFDAPVDPASFSAVMNPPTLMGAPEWTQGNTVVSFPALPQYLEDTTYTVQFEGTGQTTGLAVSPPTSITFKTVADGTEPTVDSFQPADGQTAVSPTVSPRITFSEAMNETSLQAALSIQPADCTWVLDGATGRTATCEHATAMLGADTAYTVTLTTAATDLAGLALAAPLTFSFTTGPTPDLTPPTVVDTLPKDAATGVDPSKPLSVTFSEPMAPTATEAAISITSPANTLAINFNWSTDGKTVTFQLSPAAPLNTNVTWQVGTGAKDTAGNPLTAAAAQGYKTWRFVTTTLYTDAGLDGEVRRYASTYQLFQGGSQATAGSTGSPQIFRAFFAFDMTAVFNNQPLLFQDATFNIWENGTKVGNPFGVKGPLIAENIEYGTTLEEADYNAAAIPAGAANATTLLFSNQVSSTAVHAADATDWFKKQLQEWDGTPASAQRWMQFRVRFTSEPLSTSTTSDYVGLQTGESTAGGKATLVVRYYAP